MSIENGFLNTIAWYNANAREYSQKLENGESSELLDKFAETVGAGARVLDAGSAGGRDTHQLTNRGLVAEGVDISPALVKIASEKYPNLKFKEANFLDLPYENETFDGIWAFASLLHLETIEDVKTALREFNRVLKKDGILLVFVKQQLSEEKTSLVSDKLSSHKRFFRWFTKSEMNDLLEDSHFTILESQDNIDDPNQAKREEIKWLSCLAKKSP